MNMNEPMDITHHVVGGEPKMNPVGRGAAFGLSTLLGSFAVFTLIDNLSGHSKLLYANAANAVTAGIMNGTEVDFSIPEEQDNN